MEEILISVIVPVYNILEYLPRCVQSICSQTYHNLEIILVDDGSTDGTGDLCDELACKDSRIVVIHKQNGGSSSARNVGINACHGAYLGFVDSDDFIGETMYENLITAIRESHMQLAQVGRDEIDCQGKTLPSVCIPPSRRILRKSKDFLGDLLLHIGDSSFCTKLVAKELFISDTECRYFPEGILNEDFHLLVRMLPHIEGIVSLPTVDYHVFYRIGSNTRKENKEDFSRVFEDIVDNSDIVYDIVNQEYPSLEKEAIRFKLFQRLDYLLHIPISKMNKENRMYQEIKGFLRNHVVEIITNPHLNKKNKIYLMLFTIAPKTVRKVHYLKMKTRNKRKKS